MEQNLSLKRFFRRRQTISGFELRQVADDEAGENLPPEKSERKKRGILKKSYSSFEFQCVSSAASASSEGHVNTVFSLRSDEETRKHDYFVSAFGQKGNSIGEFQDAKDITCLPNNRLLITDLINNRLQICSDVTHNITVFSPEEIHQPWATAVTNEKVIAVTLCQERCVKLFSPDGSVIFSFGKDHFSRPTGIAIDKNGNFIVCDDILKEVLMFDSNGNFMRFLGNREDKHCFKKPRYVCLSPTGEIIISDAGHHQVKIFDANGDYVRSFGSFGKEEMQFKCPYGISTNACGDIFVADHYNSRISMFRQDGTFIRHLVTSEHGLVHPQGLTISPDLRMYVTHGNLKANEILVFKLTNDTGFENINLISHV